MRATLRARAGLKSQLLNGFTDTDGALLEKSVRTLHFVMEEDSYLARFGRIKGFSYNLLEQGYCVTRTPLEMPVKKRKVFEGTNRNNIYGPIASPPYTPAHHNMICWKEKRELYSVACKVACRVGGPGVEGAESTQRKPETQEPVSFHAFTSQVWTEVLHSNSVIGVIDFTTGPGYLAEACIGSKIPYVGFVQTATHEAVVRRYLFRRTWDLMLSSGSALFEPQLHTVLQAPVVGWCKVVVTLVVGDFCPVVVATMVSLL